MFTNLRIRWYLAQLDNERFDKSLAAARALADLGPAAAMRLLDLVASQTSKRNARASAVVALASIGGDQAVELLITRLRDKNEDSFVRREAAIALSKIGDAGAVPTFAQLVSDVDDDSSVREQAVIALGAIRDTRAVQPVIELMERELSKDPELTSVMADTGARTLGQLGDRRAVGVLVKALSYPRVDVPVIAAESLGKLADPQAVEPLIAALGEDWPKIRDAASKALVCIGAPGIGPLTVALRTPHVRVEQLVLTKHSSLIRNSAARILGQIGDPRAVTSLLEALPGLDRKVAAEALARLGEPKWSSFINGSSYDWARLGESGDPRIFAPLVQVLTGHCSEDARAAAAEGLGRFRNSRAVDPLIRALQDESIVVRRDAASALGQLGDSRAVNPVIRLLSDPDHGVRERALDTLATFGGERALTAIAEQTAYDFRRAPATRWAAIAALGRIRDKRAVEPILKGLLDDPEDDIRRAAAASLTELCKQAHKKYKR